MRLIIYDAETRSIVNLKQHGSHVYTCDPTTDVWCVSYCIVVDGERGPIQTWLPSDPVPPDILTARADPDTVIVAFNDPFERQLEERILHPRYGWPIFPLHRRRCAQATALSHALPGSLDKVAAALRLQTRKTPAGKKVMKLLAKSRKPRKGEDPTQIYWHDNPKLLETLYEYNRIDVDITAEIIRQLGFISPQEQKIWELDAGINARGVCCDVELLDAALGIADQAATELMEKLTALTDGEITSAAQVPRIGKWLARHGCEVPNVQEETLLEALKRPNLSTSVKQLIDLRLNGAHAAVDKLATIRDWAGPDRRIHQAYRFHGAMPGRFTSIGVQLQNLKKPTVDDIAGAIAAVSTGNLGHMQARYERPLSVVGDITRGLIVAAPGHRLFIADLSGIESRGLAWLCNETTKLEAWREFDRTGDPTKEPYYQFGVADLRLAADSARGPGKTSDLAYGFEGSLGAWRRLAPVDDNTPDDEVYRRRDIWRCRHPNIAKFWKTSVRQAVNAIENPGERFTVARIAFIREGLFLHMELPSGRRIRYPFARPYAGERSKTFTFRDASGGRWEWYHVLKKGRGAFGGLVAENATQALCRDIFVEALLRLEAAGYRPVAHLHDEFICEVPDGFGSLKEFRHIITTPPAWAPDFPIATKARIADRFIEIKKVKADTPPPCGAVSLDVGNLPTSNQCNEPQLITAADLEAINRGLTDWGIKPLSAGIAPETTVPPPRKESAQGFASASANAPAPRNSGDGHAGNGYDASDGAQQAGKSQGNYRDDYSEKHADKPYAPVRAALLRKGYELARTFPFAVPGEAEPRFYEDRYELRPGMAPTQERPRKSSRYWHRANGKDLNGTGPRRIIYNWPAIMAAGPGADVLITEGANKSDPLNKAGLLGTAAPYHQWGEECAQALAGKHLFYLADHNPDGGDDPGPKYAADARKKLSSHAASFRVVPAAHLWKHLPSGTRTIQQGDDVKDWLELGGDPAKLLEICREIPGENTRPKYIITNLATVTPRAVRWIWPGHLARGGLELMAGTPEIGKSQIHCQYIACATTGRDWPNGMPGIIPCRVILLTAEDTIEDTLVPRLKAAGAELKLIEEFKAVRRNNHDEMFLLGEDLDTLEQMIGDFGDIGLVTIDPITAFMGHAKHFDSHRASDVRSQLSPLKRLAERTGVAFSAITHPPKNASPRALDHFIGSQAFIAAARIGHLCVAETEEGENGARRETGRRFFTNPKINIEARQATLVYRIEVIELEDLDLDTSEPIRAPVVRWEGESELTAEEALAAAKPTKSSKSKSPQEFLSDVLISGPVLRNVIVERGAERDFSLDQLKRAKKALAIEAFRKKGAKHSPWYWALLEHVPPEAELEE